MIQLLNLYTCYVHDHEDCDDDDEWRDRRKRKIILAVIPRLFPLALLFCNTCYGDVYTLQVVTFFNYTQTHSGATSIMRDEKRRGSVKRGWKSAYVHNEMKIRDMWMNDVSFPQINYFCEENFHIASSLNPQSRGCRLPLSRCRFCK